MNTIVLFVVALLCLISGACVGWLLRQRLPEHHLARESTDVIKLAAGLMATLVAMILGLLVSSANTFHGQIETQYKQGLANVAQLDQYLRAIGPEAQGIRDQLRRTVVHYLRQHWPRDDFGAADIRIDAAANPAIDLEDRILELNLTTPKQKWFQAQALQQANELVRMRQLMSNDESGRSLPIPIVAVLLAVAAAIFAMFSLFVQPNPTVVFALALAAIAVSGALFLIEELNTPFGGLLQLSRGPAHNMLATVGR